jgi:hypothetical protein
VESIRKGIEPRPNNDAQYGCGFYTFLEDRNAAERWRRHRSASSDPKEEYVVLEFRLELTFYMGLRQFGVREGAWLGRRRPELLEEYDVLEGGFYDPGNALGLAKARQVKFNHRVYCKLNAARQWVSPEEQG